MIPEVSLVALIEAGFAEADLDGVQIGMDDVRRAGYCGPGLVGWLAGKISVKDFVRQGMTAVAMMETGDAHGIRVVIKRLELDANG